MSLLDPRIAAALEGSCDADCPCSYCRKARLPVRSWAIRPAARDAAMPQAVTLGRAATFRYFRAFWAGTLATMAEIQRQQANGRAARRERVLATLGDEGRYPRTLDPGGRLVARLSAPYKQPI